MDADTTTHEGFYPTTIWSEVDRTRSYDSQVAMAALGGLLERYSRPLRAHLGYKFRVEEERAADWLHEFIARKVLLGELLSKASRDRGRFRTFLLNALDNFVVSELRKEQAQRRQPQNGTVSLENLPAGEQARLAAHSADEFTLEWARAVLAETLVRMEAACRAKSCLERWGVFQARLLGPALDDAQVPPYEDLVVRFGFRSPAEASNALITARRQFARLLSEVVAEYAGAGADVEAELRDLMCALST
jgi:DNA-directed RNA polymerase specialized sigma24 family protein